MGLVATAQSVNAVVGAQFDALFAPLDAINALIAAPLTLISSPDGFLTFDKAKYLFCTLLCYVLSLIYRRLPNNPKLKVCTCCCIYLRLF